MTAATMTHISRDSLVYDAIQRVYRPAVIRHIRERLGAHYGPEGAQRLRKALGAELWDETVRAATRSREAGVFTGVPSDEFDLVDVLYFHVLFDLEFDVLFGVRSDEPKPVRNERKSAIVGWARIVRSARNPISHPIEAEISTVEAVASVVAAYKIVALIDADAATRLAGIIDRLNGDAPATSASLPPSETICPLFVGRVTYLDDLFRWLMSDESRRRLLVGSGGKGKSAIAYEFARRVRDDPGDIRAIIWLSAKRQAFIDGDIRELPHTDFSSLDEALARILSVHGRDDEAMRPQAERRVLALNVLRDRRSLVIVDDVDSLRGKDESVHEFFLEASFTTASKFLFTSRSTIHGLGGATIVVRGLDHPDGLAFIKSRVDLYGLTSASFGSDVCATILQATDDTPLYIEDLMRLTRSGVPVDRAIQLWQDHGGEKAREYALRRQIDQLSRAARRALLAIALPDSGVSFQELGVVVGMSEDELLEAVGDLTSLSLISPATARSGPVETLALDTNTRALVRSVAERDFPDDLRQLLGAHNAVIGAVPGRGRLMQSITQATFLARSKRWADAERTLRDALEVYPDHPQLLAELGKLFRGMEPARLADARIAFERAHQLGASDPRMYRWWLRMELEAGQLTLAAKAGDVAVQRCPRDPAIHYLASTAHWQLGRQLADEGDPAASDELRQARSGFEEALSAATREPTRDIDTPSVLAAICGTIRDEIVARRHYGPVDELHDLLRDYVARWRQARPADSRLSDFDEQIEPDTSEPDQDTNLAIGDFVRHRLFGDGRVLTIAGTGPDQLLGVEFQRVGVKRVVGTSVAPTRRK